MSKKKKITVKCNKCEATYGWIVPEGYDIEKDSVCKQCREGKVKEIGHASADNKDK